jgi:ParB family chromosome partitioning protein
MNPRKTFDQHGIDELAESIKQMGILQPIIARLNTQVKKKTIPIYEVICGSRRLSAAVIADLQEVPVIVRELTDEEAFDLMITENLQRKDVKPLEEAFAFKSLIDKGTYDIESLSLRFGKSSSYIRHRLKLNDLIPEFRDLLEKEIIGLTHALEISKLESKYQEEFFEEYFKERSSYWTCPSVRGLIRDIEREFTLKLSDAPFSLDDLTLDKKAGLCTTCPKNTASNLLLFPDSPETGLCLDRSCFKHKSDIHFERELRRIQDEEPDVILGVHAGVYGEEEKDVKALKSAGVPVVDISWSNGFQRLYEPKLPQKPLREDYEDDEDYNIALYDYDSEVEEYEKDLTEFESSISSGNFRKVFMTTGNEKGKILLYEIRKEKQDHADATGSEIAVKDQIKELQEKDKRNGELAFEKTYLDAKALLEENIYSNIEENLSQSEWQAVYVLLLENIGYVPLREEINPNGSYIDNKQKIEIASKLDINQINRLFRAFLQNRLETGSPVYHLSEAKSLISIASEKYPERVKEIELKHQGVYLKRKEKIDQKIAELKQ